MRSFVVIRLQVGSRAVAISGLANGSRALWAAGLDGEPELGELRIGPHVDARHVPEDGVLRAGVLELQHVVLVGNRGQLERNAAAIGIRAPVLLVVAALRRKLMHVSGGVGYGPQVNRDVQVVDDFDATAGTRDDGGGRVAGGRQGRQGRRGAREKSCQSERLEEHLEA